MDECSACGTKLDAHETACPTCGKHTAFYRLQRRCLHCGLPAARQSKICMMCGRPVDSLPLRTSVFGTSWLGIILGLFIVGGLVIGLTAYYPPESESVAAPAVRSPTPTFTATATGTTTPLPTHTPTITLTPTPTATSTPGTHVVESGENPSAIALLYGVTTEEILELNDLDSSTGLRVGQELLIPPSAMITTNRQEEPGPPAPTTVYLIESGDTLLDIAYRHGTTVSEIIAANPEADLSLIYPGETLIVPMATPTLTPTPTNTLTPTPTPGPLYIAPTLLTPPDGEIVTADTILFNWISPQLLAEDQFYVLHLHWPDGSHSEYWTRSNSQRIYKADQPAPGPVRWYVSIMRQTGLTADNQPAGVRLTDIIKERVVEWP